MSFRSPGKILAHLEDGAALVALGFVVALPFVEFVLRNLFRESSASTSLAVTSITVSLAFLAAMIASREGKHLRLSSGKPGSFAEREPVKAATTFLSAMVAAYLFWISVMYFASSGSGPLLFGFVPQSALMAFMPLGFLVIALRFVLRSGLSTRAGKVAAILGLVAGTLFGALPIARSLDILFGVPPESLEWLLGPWIALTNLVAFPLMVVLGVSIFAGLPIFVSLAGIACFAISGTRIDPSITSIADIALYVNIDDIATSAKEILSSSQIPAIPLFTLAGFILSDSQAGQRLVRLFRSLLGWLPGGIVVAAVVVSTFFTTFTGATGVTILALGGLLAAILAKGGGLKEDPARGLITGSGSLGILFPPSLAIIMYGQTSSGTLGQVGIDQLFKGAILPGLVMVLAMSAMGVFASLRGGAERQKFSGKEAFAATKDAAWEILLPVVIVVCYLAGLLQSVEIGALAVVYVCAVEVFVKRDLKFRELSKTALKALPVVGGVLIILAAARGLSDYITFTDFPSVLAGWVQGFIDSPFSFLLFVNLLLLVTGCMMDIFSAILVVAPLLFPLAAHYGVHPVHLGVIFLMNLGIGFITPPVGMNIFISAYTFDKPISRIVRSVLPYFVVQVLVLLLVTYVPWFSLALLGG